MPSCNKLLILGFCLWQRNPDILIQKKVQVRKENGKGTCPVLREELLVSKWSCRSGSRDQKFWRKEEDTWGRHRKCSFLFGVWILLLARALCSLACQEQTLWGKDAHLLAHRASTEGRLDATPREGPDVRGGYTDGSDKVSLAHWRLDQAGIGQILGQLCQVMEYVGVNPSSPLLPGREGCTLHSLGTVCSSCGEKDPPSRQDWSHVCSTALSGFLFFK